jgi:GTP cyclohydrolase I
MSSSYNGETELEAAERRIRSLPKCGAAKLARMEDTFRNLLEAIGESPQREGLLRTPLRAALAFEFLTNGYRQNLDEIVNGAIFSSEASEIILVKDIELYSMCEHHLLPFIGRAHVAYIPNGKVIGLSKIARIVDVFARRLQIQEQLTVQIADALMNCLQPNGVGVVVEGSRKAELRNENLLLARLIQGRRAHPLGISLAAKRVVAQASGLWRRMRACRVHIRAADSLATSQARCLTFGVVQL